MGVDLVVVTTMYALGVGDARGRIHR